MKIVAADGSCQLPLPDFPKSISIKKINVNTDMVRLTTGIRSEKFVGRQFRRCANVIECTGTRRLKTLRSSTDRIYDGDAISL